VRSSSSRDAADRAFPLTRAQLDIWFAQQTDRCGSTWQLGMLGRIEGTVEPALLEPAVRQVVRESEPLRAAFFELDGAGSLDIPTDSAGRGRRCPARRAGAGGERLV
jgi:hypothetical protein